MACNVCISFLNQMKVCYCNMKVRVYFIHYWVYAFRVSNTIPNSMSIPWKNESTIIKQPLVKVNLSSNYTILASFFIIFISSIIILCVANQKQKRFVTKKKKRGNPCKLVANVLLFACKHKSPIRRSAFTLCENELPSRIAFS